MSLVLNMVGCGAGGIADTDAVLLVTVPVGSTVTATKGGVTLTPTMWVQAADNTLETALFAISPSLFDAQNPWIVTASLSPDTESASVTISSNKQYDLQIEYPTNLYKNGTEYVSWGTSGYSYESLTLIAFEKQASSLYVAGAAGENKARMLGTTASVNLSGYSTLSVDVDISNAASTGLWLSVTSSKTLTNSMNHVNASSAGQYTINYDISNMSGNYYVALSSGNGRYVVGNITSVYMKK